MKLIETEIQECSANHIFKLDINRLARINAMGSNPLLWCNDVIFFIGDFEHSEAVTKSQLQGRYFVDTILYTESPLIDQVKWNGYTVEVLDMSGHKFYEELTEGLKNV
ncbi:hypothetical protein [Nitrosopumilus sp. Nsub]|uniref:hypothetical protein n=1 Tax=Nitrosopumilus sp. Nsub TaxID=1776294 RepID=UPI000B042B96|nr:hypothetical protein [Nitrosopumilus sp. Nsub]